MKRILFTMLVAAGLMVTMTPLARADALLTIDVSGTPVTCNTSAAFTATNCGAGFTAVAGGNTISFTGTVNGVSFGGGSTVGVQLTNNSPGTSALGFATDTKTTVNNTSSGSRTIAVLFAVNNFTLPAGTPLPLTAAQGVDLITSSANITETFSGFGNAANSLTGVPTTILATPPCTAPAGTSTVCSTSAGPVNFPRVGAFALGGAEGFTLVAGAITNAHASVTVTPAIPEPTSVLLLGSGMLLLVGLKLRKK